MNDLLKHLRKLAETRYAGTDALRRIEQTLLELEVYLESNPEDEIALVQYRQFAAQRAGFLAKLSDSPDDLSDSEIQA
ncbi:hypothetical protein L1N85_26470 [Paenibacillus alkaliterrae]|uniref:hypothetical protein n=1 Tax=Paenibacillus alkaliterrae TaxID=320909 RepID=UPI001F3EA6CE|nr:hypothetical protein [Paenibacillus alkaliterrae]MCF2941872.1 hypothetical protein [Paenibacillus alkaliterrae]